MSVPQLNRTFIYTFMFQRSIFQSVRLYGRWTHRTPAKVLLPFEPTSKVSLKKENVIDLNPEVLHKPEKQINVTEHENKDSVLRLSPEKSKEIKDRKQEKLNKRNFYISQLKVFDDNKEIIYEKLKENDSRISSLLVKLKSKKERLRTNQVLVEGRRLIIDGLEAQCPLKYIIFSQIEDLNNIRPFLPMTGVKIYKIPYKEIELWSNVETSPGIIGVFEMPTPENVKILGRPLPLRFICDNIRIPGNLGAILRAAVAVGCEKVILTKGCVDLWDPKVVRAATGAHFRLPVHYSVDWEDMPKFLEEDTSVFIADSNAKIVDNENSVENRFEGLQVPVLPYYSIEYASLKNITLIIGGETEGISEDSYRFATSRNGLRLHIPLQHGVDSLNSGSATAVIAFEIRKQLIKAWTEAKHGIQVQAT